MRYAPERLVPRQVGQVDVRTVVVEAKVSQYLSTFRAPGLDRSFASYQPSVVLIQVRGAEHVRRNRGIVQSDTVHLDGQ